MRVLELTAHVQIIRRKDGRTATAAAAYRSCERIECEREGVVHDYRRKQGLEASGIVMPAHAPAWLQSRSALWNAAEMRERNGSRGANAGQFRARATVAREVVFGFPAELSPEGRLRLAARVARHLVDTYGLACDLSLHEPGKLGDKRNHHCHLLMSTRRVTATGLGTKAREWDGHHAGSRTVSAFRAFLAGAMNETLAEEGHGAAVHVEHRSYKTRGSSTVPTKHQGPGRTNAQRVRQARERQAWEREARREQAGRQATDRAAIAQLQGTRGTAKLRDIEAREVRAIAAARADHAPPPQKPAGGLARLMQGLTGRGPPAPAQPDRAVEPRVVDVRSGFEAERERFRADQAREVGKMADRHLADDRQLDRAASLRVERDRIEEVTDRRREVERHHERTQDDERERKR